MFICDVTHCKVALYRPSLCSSDYLLEYKHSNCSSRITYLGQPDSFMILLKWSMRFSLFIRLVLPPPAAFYQGQINPNVLGEVLLPDKCKVNPWQP